MKKRLALLLAAVMVLSLAPTAFAATNNSLDNHLSVPEKSILFEDGVLGAYQDPASYADGAASWYVDGTDLVLPLQREVKDGYTFRLVLSNADWYFKSADSVVNSATDADINSYYALPAAYNTLANRHDSKTYALDPAGTMRTYDDAQGIFIGKTNTSGTYYRRVDYYTDLLTGNFITPAAGATPITDTTMGGVVYHEAAYKLDVSDRDASTAVITVIGDYKNPNSTEGFLFRVPLVTYIKDSNVEATVKIESGNASTVTSQTLRFATTGSGKTKATAEGVVVSRDTFELEPFIVSELRTGTIRSNEVLILSLPRGYHFEQNWGNASGDIVVGIEPGMAWGDASKSIGNGTYQTFSAAGSTPAGKNYTLQFGDDIIANDKLSAGSTSNQENDSELFIYLGALTSSDQITGAVYIENLKIYADDDAALPATGKEYEIKIHVEGDTDNISEQDVLVAKRVEWLLGLKTLNAVPTLVSGRYIGPTWDGTDADSNIHKTARVQLYESASNSWWGARTTILTLPATDNNTIKGAKFRKVFVDDYDNVDTSPFNLKGTYNSVLYSATNNPQNPSGNPRPNEAGVYLNDGEKHGYITVNDNKITISNIRLTGKATIDFDLWVSVELGFGKQTGDLKLSIDPTSTSVTGNKDDLPSVVIAHVVDPVAVSAKITDLKIGYQYQTTSDIQITEIGPGYLLRNKTVRVSITDLISSDLYYTNDTKIAVTSGDLKIKNIIANGQGGFTSQSKSWLDPYSVSNAANNGSLSFEIEKESTVASTITISNVAVKIDRTVPVTNKSSYQAVVWGTAIAENYGLVDDKGRTWKAGFNTVGEYVPYINVISSPGDAASILTQEVRVTIGESFYTVNGKTYTMDAVAYISPASNSTMVPLRFVANAFGLGDDKIIWDDTNKTATIMAPNKVLQFTLNKSQMIVNGVAINMLSPSPEFKPVSAEIKTINGLGRMYLPFRALGEAFGIPVDWDAATQTAIYNKGANTNVSASVTNPTPIPTASPTPTP